MTPFYAILVSEDNHIVIQHSIYDGNNYIVILRFHSKKFLDSQFLRGGRSNKVGTFPPKGKLK